MNELPVIILGGTRLHTAFVPFAIIYVLTVLWQQLSCWRPCTFQCMDVGGPRLVSGCSGTFWHPLHDGFSEGQEIVNIHTACASMVCFTYLGEFMVKLVRYGIPIQYVKCICGQISWWCWCVGLSYFRVIRHGNNDYAPITSSGC